MYRTHNCNELTEENVGERIKLSGWIQTIRDVGSIIFMDLRDHYGITQIVVEKEEDLEKIRSISEESVVSIEGTVRMRKDPNPKIASGKIEVVYETVEVLSKAKKEMPFVVMNSKDTGEDLRLKYRFLDLRNQEVHKKIILRAKFIKAIRDKMNELGFMEIQTPILTSSSPEGARDYLVPSRNYPGKFYALPQAPQQFKQLLMASGFDKYFQIAPCFRDEDARADRSPGEFYQLDVEMAFATQEDVFNIMEKVIHDLFCEFTDKEVSPCPFVRIPYREAIEKYGSDKPDLRNQLILVNGTGIFDRTDFKLLKNKHIRMIKADCSGKSRKFYDKLDKFVKDQCEGSGLFWVKFNEDMSVSGSISKFVDEDTKNEIVKIADAKAGDSILIIAEETESKAVKIAGIVRNEVGRQLDIIEKDTYKFCWIVDFPMYEINDEGKLDFCHNPFSMPQGGLEALNTMEPLDILAYQYDIVCNGIELSSGAVRNHDPEIMVKAFELAGYTKDVVESKFPALFNAFQYGAPPHAGIAPGVDRMLMLITGDTSIREVIAFPMNSKAQDLLMNAPAEVTEQQLRELHLNIKEKK